MEKVMKINDQITVGPQPTEKDLKRLKEQGFKSVVNFRTEGEENQPLSPAAEGEKALELELEYRHIPVSMKEMKAEQVEQFRREFRDLPKPVFAHCGSGKRAGAMAMMHVASEQGMSGGQAIETAMHMGFECDKPELVEFVRQYIDEHSGGRR